MFEIARRTMYLIGRENRTRWLGLALFSAFTSAVEMLGALLVYALVALVADPQGQIDIPVVGDIRRLFEGTDEVTMLLTIVIIMGVFFIFRAGVVILVNYLQLRLGFNTGATLASRLAAGYLALPYAFHLHRHSSELIHNTNAAALQLVNAAFLPLIRIVAGSLTALGLLIVVMTISPTATLLAVLVVGGAVLILLRFIQPRLKQLGGVSYHMHQALISSMQQSLQGLRDIKLLGRERHFAGLYRAAADRLSQAAYVSGTFSSLPRVVMELALLGFILTFFGLSVAAGTATAEMLSILGLFAYVGLRVQPALNEIVKSANELRFATETVEGVEQDLRLIEGIEPQAPGQLRPFREKLQVQGMSFRYEGAEEDALTDVDLTIRPGETVGICGPTGSGKTTLVDLLAGLLTPSSGRIVIDGEDLHDDVRGWQRNLGVVPQMVFLIDDSLRRNIALGVPDDRIDAEALDEAVRLAQLEEFVARSPQGLDSIVGEGGVRISGGQRQRIAIARALYRKASVLMLDEGTSALDNATEAALMASLERLRGDYTIILVAHRLSTVQGCDRVIYVDGGRIAAIGPYDQLLETSPQFRALARRA